MATKISKILFLSCLISFQFCNSAGQNVEQDTLGKGSEIVSFATNLLNAPYKYGGASPEGFDCSGFVYYVFGEFGVTVPRSSRGYENCSFEEINVANARAGDIIVFTGTNPETTPYGHVGIVTRQLSPQNPEFIHSSSSAKRNGIVINTLESGYYQKRFVKIVRPTEN